MSDTLTLRDALNQKVLANRGFQIDNEKIIRQGPIVEVGSQGDDIVFVLAWMAALQEKSHWRKTQQQRPEFRVPFDTEVKLTGENGNTVCFHFEPWRGRGPFEARLIPSRYRLKEEQLK